MIPLGKQMVRKQSSLFANVEKDVEDQINHTIILCQSLIQSKILTFLNFMKVERRDEALEEGLRKEVFAVPQKYKEKA